VGCNPGHQRNSDSGDRIFRNSTNHSNACTCIHPCIYPASSLPLVQALLVLAILLSMVLVLVVVLVMAILLSMVLVLVVVLVMAILLSMVLVLVVVLVMAILLSTVLVLVVVLVMAILLSMVVVLVVVLVMAILLSVVVVLVVVAVLDTPTSYNCVFLAFPGILPLLQHKSWFPIHFHNFLSTYSNRPNDSNHAHSQW